MSEVKLAQPIAVIDMANMREDSNVKSLFRRGASNYSSWEYIDSVASSLKKSIENLTVIPVFDAGLVNNFKGVDIEITNQRKQLNYYDDDYIYFMREHYVEADPLILNIADELNGFVISSDQYEKYPSETLKINGNVFVPVKNRNTGEFAFFKSLEFYELRGKYRNFDDATMRGVSTLQRCLDHDSNSVKNDAIIREKVFGDEGIEVRYWESRFRTVRQGEKKALKDRPFANLKLIFSATSKKDKEPKELVVKRNRQIAKKLSEPRVIFCDELNQLDTDVNSEVYVVGKLGRFDEQIFVEWFRGDKAVLISNFTTKKDLDRSFIKISGFLSKGNDYFELELNENIPFEQLSFAEAVVHRLSRLVSRSRDEPRRWHLPSLQWGEKESIHSNQPAKDTPLSPPLGYRHRNAGEAVSKADSEQSEAQILNNDVSVDYSEQINQAQISSDEPESVTSTAKDQVSQQIDKTVGVVQTVVLNKDRSVFGLSVRPCFRKAIIKLITLSDTIQKRSHIRKWLYVIILAFAIGNAYFVWDNYFRVSPPDTQLNLDKSSYSVQIVNASGRVGSAGELTIELQLRGFVLEIPTTKSSALPIQRETVIYYLPDHLGAAALVSRELGGGGIFGLSVKIPTSRGELGEASVLVLLGSDIAGRALDPVTGIPDARRAVLKCWGAVKKICEKV